MRYLGLPSIASPEPILAVDHEGHAMRKSFSLPEVQHEEMAVVQAQGGVVPPKVADRMEEAPMEHQMEGLQSDHLVGLHDWKSQRQSLVRCLDYSGSLEHY